MNLKIIKNLDVLGKKIKVVFRDMTEENVCGHYIYSSNLIEINNMLTKETQEITLIHELIHAVFFRAGVLNTKVSEDIEEIICDQVAKVITENFKLTKNKQ